MRGLRRHVGAIVRIHIPNEDTLEARLRGVRGRTLHLVEAAVFSMVDPDGEVVRTELGGDVLLETPIGTILQVLPS